MNSFYGKINLFFFFLKISYKDLFLGKFFIEEGRFVLMRVNCSLKIGLKRRYDLKLIDLFFYFNFGRFSVLRNIVYCKFF